MSRRWPASLILFLSLVGSGCAPGSLYHVSCSHPSHPDGYWCAEYRSQKQALAAFEEHRAGHPAGWDGVKRAPGPCPYGRSEE